jgi:O-antigen/teichoic acid export membrane protein
MMPKGLMARNVSLLVGGTVFGQGLNIIISPIITRLYDPGDFGTLAAYTSLLSILTIVATLRYELAIPLPEDDVSAINLVLLSVVLLGFMSLLFTLGLLVFGGQLITLLNIPTLRPYLWLLPIGIFASCSYQVFNYWATRKQAFGKVAQTKLSRSLSSTATQLSLGFIASGPLGLILGQLMREVAGTTNLVRAAKKQMEGVSSKAIGVAGILKVAQRYKRFPLYSSWSKLLNTFSVQIPNFALLYFFGTHITGLYALAFRILQTPLILVGQAVSQVFLSTAAGTARSGQLNEEAKKAFARLVWLGAPGLFLVGIAAPEIFVLVFGESWKQAGIYAQWLTPYLFLVFASSPLAILPAVLDRQGFELGYQLTLFAGRCFSLLLGGYFFNDPQLTIALFASYSALCLLFFSVWTMSISGNSPLVTLSILGKGLLVALAACLPVIVVKAMIGTDLAVLGTTMISLLAALVFSYFRVRKT